MRTMRGARPAAIVAVAIAAGACYFGDDDSSGGDGGPGDGGTPDATPPPERRPVNFVLVESGTASAESHAEFNRDGDLGTCLVAHFGPCIVEDECMPESGTLPHAGAITITGDLTSVAMTPSVDGRYPPGAASGPLWTAGAAVRFQAPGGDVPAFDETVSGAPAITLVEPVISGSLAIPRDQPLHVAWTGGDGSSVMIAFVFTDAAGQGNMRCTYDGADGQADVPVEALAQLPVGGVGSFVATGENRRTVRIGDAFDVRFIARAAFQRFPAMFP